MPEFRPPSYGPMNREYHENLNVDSVKPSSDIEAPIFPISEMGQTIPETDPSGRFKTFIQQAQASIRSGAGKLQIAMNVPHTSAMGGRFKAYGKEVREALREVAMANQVEISGVEMPTSSMSNMSGYDPQRNRFSDEVRKDHIDEVKDAIKFTAESCQGGGVDILSWEFERPINDAGWNEPGKEVSKKKFQQPGEMEMIQVVDTKTGGVVGLRKNEVQHLPYAVPTQPGQIEFNKDSGRWEIKTEISEIKEGIPTLEEWTWEKFQKTAKLINEEAKKSGLPEVQPETLLIQMQLEGQRRTAVGYAGHYGSQAESQQKIMNVIQPIIKDFDKLSEEERRTKLIENLEESRVQLSQQGIQQLQNAIGSKETLTAFFKDHEVDFRHLRSLAEGQMQQVREIEERQKRFKSVSEYAVDKAVQSYAELGIVAMQESQNKNPFMKHPIHVGPEIGWPQFYGSHPEEFVNLILDARKEMTHRLVKQGFSEDKAKEEAREHIKGVFDTSHLGMWLRNFKPDLPWDTRVKEFNKWFTGQVEKLAEVNKKENIIGAIQAVDTITGAHAHLPPGQGVLPIKEAINILKQKGKFNGFIVSEGHEEEKFGEGRILLKGWESMGAHFENKGYNAGKGAPLTWNAVQNSYFGKTYSPMFMFGSYSPSAEFKLWSEIPLE